MILFHHPDDTETPEKYRTVVARELITEKSELCCIFLVTKTFDVTAASSVFISGFPRSWKILKFETILESHGKVMDFLSFFKKSWKTDISRKSHGILHKPSVLCTMYGYGSLVDCIYKFTTFFPALS